MTCGYQTWQKGGYVMPRDKWTSLYIYFTKIIATKLDKVMACEIKISTPV